ncbi:MAG: D-aminoacylase [Vicinamibacterales bacterium]|nr:D-aminoacylase [Vicinamibacterales bacterium]
MRPKRSAAWLALVVTASVVALKAQVPRYDLVIRNARVVDGTGSPWFRGDVGIRGDQIAAIARRIDAASTRTIDAADQVIAPGFVDIHVHAFGGAGQPPSSLPIIEVPTADNYVRQGVTTLITGPDGFSPVPLRPVLELVARTGITPNLGTFIGHGSIRDAVFGSVNRAPTDSELDRMRSLAREGMRDGAFGLSTGLFYVPAAFSKTDEVVELAKVVGAMGGIHISHMRDEELGVEASVRETIAIGEQGGLPTQVTHHKVIGKTSWGKTVATLRQIDEARQRGVDVTVDVYPYPASSTTISAALMPIWAQEGSREDILKRLRDPATRRRIQVGAIQIILEGRGGGDARNVMVSRCDWNPSLAGQRLDDVAATRGKSRSVEDAADTALWLVESGDCGGIYFAIGEEDIQRVLRHPASMIGSDGQVVLFGRASPHPRSYGTFGRVLGRYVRDLKTLTLEDAIRKMSSYPAQRIGLGDRGILREGMKADLVVFDPATVRDMATFEQPHQYAQGVSVVVINGQVAFENGAMTSARPGRILYGPAHTP